MQNITIEQFRQMRTSEKPLLIDVRSRAEFAQAHILGAVSVPLETLGEFAQSHAKDTRIVCQCQSGGRSKVAGLYLAEQGFSQVYNLEGGLSSWMASGGEVASE